LLNQPQSVECYLLKGGAAPQGGTGEAVQEPSASRRRVDSFFSPEIFIPSIFHPVLISFNMSRQLAKWGSLLPVSSARPCQSSLSRLRQPLASNCEPLPFTTVNFNKPKFSESANDYIQLAISLSGLGFLGFLITRPGALR
jgi:hypothetical protein